MSLRHALLGALADEPRNGYALLKHFEQSLGYAWPASHSQIYPELARLVDEGLIEQTGAGARNSKTYALTDAGLDEIRRWLESTTPERRVRNDATLRMFFLWLLEPEEAVKHLEREREYAAATLAEFRRISEEPTGREQEGADLPDRPRRRDPLAETRIEWLDWAIEQVRSPKWRSLE